MVQSSEENVIWSLSVLESILKVFYYLEINKSNTPGYEKSRIITGIKLSIISTWHISIICEFLGTCEKYMNQRLESDTGLVDEGFDERLALSALNMSLSQPPQQTPLELLYYTEPSFIKIYKQIIRLLYDLVTRSMKSKIYRTGHLTNKNENDGYGNSFE